jgi:hypothetical protein
MNNSISAAQLKKLQTLWGHWWKLHWAEESGVANDVDHSRAARLRYLSDCLKRPIASAKELSRDEAEGAIKGLAAALPNHLNTKKKRLSRDRAQELGTAGRKGVKATGPESLVGEDEIRHIQDLLEQLGWNRARLDEFLRSRYSPLGRGGQIRTVANANRVRWALKRILERQKKASAA